MFFAQNANAINLKLFFNFILWFSSWMISAWREEELRLRPRKIKMQMKNLRKTWEVEVYVLFQSPAHSKSAATTAPTIGLRRSARPVSSESQWNYATWNSNLRENDITSRAVSLLRNQQSEFPRLIAHDGIQSTSSNTLLENFRLAFDEYAFIVTSLLLSDAQAVCLRALRNCYFIYRLIVICF